MERLFNDDEKRLLLAELIKASKTDIVLLADFVRVNCVRYSWWDVQLPHGKGVNQCIGAVERILDAPVPPQSLRPPAPSWSWNVPQWAHDKEIAESDSGYGGSTLAYSPAPSSIAESIVPIQPHPPLDFFPRPLTSVSSEPPLKKRRGRPARGLNRRLTPPLAPLRSLAPEPVEHQPAPRKMPRVPASYIAPAPSRPTGPNEALLAESSISLDQLHDYKGATSTPDTTEKSKSSHSPTRPRENLAEPREGQPGGRSPAQPLQRETPTTAPWKSRQDSSELQPGEHRPSDERGNPPIRGGTHNTRLSPIEPSPPLKKSPTAQDMYQTDSLDQDVSKRRSPSPLQDNASSDSSSTSESTAKFPTTRYRYKGSTIDEVCDVMLSMAFETTLDELDAPEEAWRSVRRCLAELSTIVECQEFLTAQNGGSHQSLGEPCPSSVGTPGSASRKRKRIGGRASEGSGSGNDDADGDGRGAANGSSSPRKKRSKNIGGLSCPYRKRNPLRFNVRSHDNCSLQGYRDITLLKRHILWSHKRPSEIPRVMCSRCREGFATQADVDAHLRVRDLRDMCALAEPGVRGPEADPEDGISPAVDQRLRNRAASQQVLDWPTLWLALFPDDTLVPDSAFNPVVELDEVEVTFHRKSPAFRPVIYDRLLCAAGESLQHISVTESLADAMCDAFKELFAQTIEESRATFGFSGGIGNQEPSHRDEGTRSAANGDAASSSADPASHISPPNVRAASHGGSSEVPQGGPSSKLLLRPPSTPCFDATYTSLLPMAETVIHNSVSLELPTAKTATYSNVRLELPAAETAFGNNVSLGAEGTGELGSSRDAVPVERPADPGYCLGCSQSGPTQCVCSTIWNFSPDFSTPYRPGDPD